MNKVIKAIASIMIIILICALIYIFLAYYRDKDAINTIVFSSGEKSVSTLNISSGEYISNETFINNEGLIESIIKDVSGDPEKLSGNKNISKSNRAEEEINNSETRTSGDSKVNNEIISQNEIIDSLKSGEFVSNPIEIDAKEDNNSEQLLISSDPKTSNQEKQEILTEIDEALKGLLEAVGKVEVVDEEKLNAALDSEVDNP